ncbi:MAG: primosomal protein N', partial [Lachnospiraceae bacterium]|nr:primosomal protein N' [Lachnospiraceae bacterium]
RTFQLLTQVAGRAGRGTKPGEAVIQTYRPEHYSIVRAAQQDYNAFYEEEILYREICSYPPAAHMLAVLITSPIEETGMELAGKLAELAKKTIAQAKAEASVIGPAKASIGKINDVYRFMVYCKSSDEDILIKIRDLMEQFTAHMESKREIVQFDFDPMSSY